MRIGPAVVAISVAGLLLASGSQALPHTAGATDPIVTIRYEGTLDTSAEPIMKLPDGRNLQRAHYRWSFTWHGRLSRIEQSPRQAFTVQTLTGTVSYVDRTSAEKADCTGSYVRKPGATPGLTISYNRDQGSIGVNVSVPVSSEFLVPTNTTSLHEFCSEVMRWAIPGSAMIPYFQLSLKGGTSRHDVTVPPQEPNRERGELRQSLTVAVGTPTTAGVDAKARARADLRLAIERAKGPCLHLALSLGVLATGAVWTSVAAIVPGGIPAGGAVIATGEIMGAASGPLCTEVIKQIVVDYSIFKRDPPVADRAPVLRLPACTRWQGALRAYCTRLSAAARSLAAAEHRVVGALQALEDAALELAAARRSGKAASVASSQLEVDRRAASLAAARSAASAAGARLAATIRAAGVRGTLTKAQSAATISALLTTLAKQGVPAADLRQAAGSSLEPGTVDILRALAAG